MIRARRSDDRGRFDLGWLDTRHTFSFGEYHDPEQMGFRSLRVINEDVIAPGTGFPMHPHRDMEIISYVRRGALEHADSMGNGSVIRAGDFQMMSAGRGVRHSEANPSESEPVHLFQIWIVPRERRAEPRYGELRDVLGSRRNELVLAASPDGAEGSLPIRQDARVYVGRVDAGRSLTFATSEDRGVWVQVAAGEVSVLGESLAAGDGAAITDEERVEIEAQADSELLLFDMG